SLVQAALTQQPSSLSAKVGETVRITCSGFSGSAAVTVIYNNDKRPSGIPSRFSGSISGSSNTLTITGVQAEDEAVYFCGSWDSSSTGRGDEASCSLLLLLQLLKLKLKLSLLHCPGQAGP
ncbi:hypothetical protein DV515_00019738, partial [Chloebia gouldiae]